ncbi:MAG: YggT family protein [Actinomycetota bacterium]|nr:YggT family protein [Actinomycetota bacterium]
MNVLNILAFVVEAYVVVLIARALLSWLPARPGTVVYRIVRVLDSVTEPVLRPIRRVLPPIRAGGMGIDLSIIVVVIVAELVVIPLLRA